MALPLEVSDETLESFARRRSAGGGDVRRERAARRRPSSKTVELGTINFPTSAKPAAQAPFLTGVKALYNFEFDIAAEAFREAQKADPGFALGYWGEAMSYNHPLWAQQDLPAARKVLERLAPTAAARAAKAPAGKERELIEVARSAVRRRRQARARHRLRRRDEDDAREVSRTTTRSRASTRWRCSAPAGRASATRATRCRRRRSRRASSSATRKHPGAAHYIIHSFDDPDHAILSLTAARAYSKIAPSAAHALHMPSHIFVQLGMWDDVVASNIVAYKAAVDLADAKNLPRGREDFHTLSWLQYAYLQQGKFDEAQKCVDQAKAVADKDDARRTSATATRR